MSVVFENRSALRNDPYSTVVDDGDLVEDGDRRFSPNVVPDLIGFPSDENPMLPASPDSSGIMNMPQTPERRLSPPARAETDPASPLRMRPIAKPQRQATKNLDGKYCCTFPGCTEPVKQFGRKCEWSKHMDKHDRPYKCPAEGCENLPGFTYSGGLLRHEREVHGKHGGPKNPLNCPHLNCKRHTGKGFSRLENLNEHLRRVHTPGNSGPPSVEGEPDEFVALRALETPAPAVVAVNGGAPAPSPGGVGVAAGSEKTGEKRKADTDLHDQVKRLQMENQHLRSQVEAQKRQQIAMMEQMQELREHLEGRAGLRLVGANDPVVGGDSSED
ncbi:hypothetical protein GGS23DRAFT_385493 [Durotheca rogersii]|uniref:uncharacterized protein n=1 Tax=Durotheca rogersii TaxID=419775 RepID=UPI00221EB72A|nr:uncharacterized protein GGS23DRAFT_385493 [Durotheca rogersii]KAI5857299.1 hypothetical protein GGS23DRAFT_385493 [Durotheca rogersii]